MALRLICGPTGSGKSQRAIAAFLDGLETGKNPLFAAPSQPDAAHFLRNILRNSTANVISGGKITTFSGICDDLLPGTEPERRRIGENEKRLFMQEVISSMTDLTFLKRSSTHKGFVNAAALLVSELREAGITPDGLAGAAKGILRPDLNAEIQWIYRDYLSTLEEKKIEDTEGWQNLALEKLEAIDSYPGRQLVVIDGFYDFTPQQKKFIALLRHRLEELVVTLPYLPGKSAYEFPQSEFPDLFEWAASDMEQLDEVQRGRHAALLHVDRNLFEDATANALAPGGAIRRLRGSGDRGEAELVAAEILRLYRTGIKLDGIAVVFRSLGRASGVMEAVLEEYGVPFELQGTIDLKDSVLGSLALSALSYLRCEREWSATESDVPPDPGPRECLLRFLRNPIPGIDASAVDRFAREAGLKGLEEPAELSKLWRDVAGVEIPYIASLKDASKSGIRELGRQLCVMALESVSDTARATVADRGMFQGSTGSDLVALKALHSICGEAGAALDGGASVKEATGREAVDLLTFAMEDLRISLPAASKRGCVRLLDPHRILNQNFEVVFLCGLLEDHFPANQRTDPFISNADRQLLNKKGMSSHFPASASSDENADRFDLLDAGDNHISKERFLFHRTLSRATDAVYLCYPYCDAAGKENVVSLFVDETLEMFEPIDSGCDIIRPITEVVFPPELAPNRAEALRSLCLLAGETVSYGRRAPSAAVKSGLIAAAATVDLDRELASCLEQTALSRQAINLSEPDIIEELKQKTSFSATGLEKYAECSFKYFVEKFLKPALMEDDNFYRNRGVIAHAVLADFGRQMKSARVASLGEAGGGLFLASDQGDPPSVITETERLYPNKAAAHAQLDFFLDKHTNRIGDDLDSKVLKSSLHHFLHELIETEADEISSLKPTLFECAFGFDQKEDGWQHRCAEINLHDGLTVRGKIDRIDIDELKNLGVVIDYKMSKTATPQRAFRSDGKIQIPLYLMAIQEIWGLTPIGGQYYAIMAPAKKRRRGVWKRDNAGFIGNIPTTSTDFVSLDEFNAIIEDARQDASELARGIRRAEFKPGPRNGDCGRCDLHVLCRIQELSEA